MTRVPAAVPALLASAALLAACAAPAPTRTGDAGPAPAPVRPGVEWAPVDVGSVAELLRLEDRRDWNPERLAALAAHDDAEVRRRAVLAAARIGGDGAGALVRRALADADTSVAATAAWGLGQLRDTASATVEALAARLDPAYARGAPTVAGEAADALGKLGTDRARAAVDDFLRAFAVGGARVPTTAVERALLASFRAGRGADLQPAARWLAAPDPELRWRAAYALYRRRDPAAVPVLLPLARDPDPRVRMYAVRALTAAAADSSSVGRARAREVLLGALADPDRNVRIDAVRSLSGYSAPAVVSALTPLVAGDDAYLAITAAQSLASIGADAAPAAGTLASAAADPARPVQVREEAAAALGAVDSGRAARVADELAASDEWRLRAAAGRACAAVGADALECIARAFRDRDPRVRSVAVSTAGGAFGEEAPPRLRALLVERVGDDDPIVRAAALDALAPAADPSLLPLFMDAYARAQEDREYDDAALAAVRALGRLAAEDPAAANAFLERFRRSEDPLVRRAAAAAFGADRVRAAWGDPLPMETGLSSRDYVAVVREYVEPVLEGEPRPRAVVQTEAGTFELELFAEEAPLTVRSFVELARRGYFDGQRWPRVVPDFVVQGGDPRGDMSGGPGYAIRDELNRRRYGRGTLGMALAGPDTGGSQFFVTHSPQPHLDGGYTVFGRVVRGMEVVDRVLAGDPIHRVTIVRGPAR